MSVTEHKNKPQKKCVARLLRFPIRTEETDKSGQLLHELLKEAGHTVTSYEIVKMIKKVFSKQC